MPPTTKQEPPDELEALVRRGRDAQRAADEVLAQHARGELHTAGEDLNGEELDALMRGDTPAGVVSCVSCSCWDEDACYPPCSWNQDFGALCSNCAPPLVLVDGRDVDDDVLEVLKDGLLYGFRDIARHLRLDEDDVAEAVFRLEELELVERPDADSHVRRLTA